MEATRTEVYTRGPRKKTGRAAYSMGQPVPLRVCVGVQRPAVRGSALLSAPGLLTLLACRTQGAPWGPPRQVAVN